MSQELIRVRDFAESCGCTPQNIYLHLKNYAQELEGHTVQGKGRQGILLDAVAQDFLRSVMYPKELGENPTAQENEKLRVALAQALQENARLLARAISAEGERDKALLDAGEHQRLLMASQAAQEAQEAELTRTKDNLAAMTIAAGEAKTEAITARSEADQLHLELEQERAANRALKGRNWWERLTRKGE